MKILVVGSGVIGSIYAARLHEAGNTVTLLARGNRYEEIRRNGVTISNTLVQAWLKIHAVFISCMTAAIIIANGDSVRLRKDRSAILRLVTCICEGFDACKALGMSIQPTNLKIIFMVMPKWFSVLYWRNALRGKIGRLAMAPHANAAQAEMRLLAEEVIAVKYGRGTQVPNGICISFSMLLITIGTLERLSLWSRSHYNSTK